MTRELPATLWHYTCIDRASMIDKDGGWLKPGSGGLLWLTDLAPPLVPVTVLALGLTSETLSCDRSEVPYELAEPFGVFVRSWLDVRREFGALGQMLEEAPGARPAHWYVSTRAVVAFRQCAGTG